MRPTNTDDIFAALAAPFPQEEVKFRVGRSGKGPKGFYAMILAYIDARAVMDRLDAVLGPENWKDAYQVIGSSTFCDLSIRINGEWITKTDGAEQTDIEATKGGISDAFKRAAVKWGIFRYGYNLGDSYAIITTKDDPEGRWAQTKEKESFFWKPKPLPEWALPANDNNLAGKGTGNIQEAPASSAPPSAYEVLRSELEHCRTLAQLAEVWKKNQAKILMLPKKEQDQILSLKDLVKDELTNRPK